MSEQNVKIAQLSTDALAKLKTLETELGTAIVALEPQAPFATLNQEQTQKLADLEKELGVVLLAYKTQP